MSWGLHATCVDVWPPSGHCRSQCAADVITRDAQSIPSPRTNDSGIGLTHSTPRSIVTALPSTQYLPSGSSPPAVLARAGLRARKVLQVGLDVLAVSSFEDLLRAVAGERHQPDR